MTQESSSSWVSTSLGKKGPELMSLWTLEVQEHAEQQWLWVILWNLGIKMYTLQKWKLSNCIPGIIFICVLSSRRRPHVEKRKKVGTGRPCLRF